MEAGQVIDKIMADAKAEAENIKRQAAERQAAERGELDEQLAQFAEETETMAQQAAEDEKAHRLAAARMAAAKEYLAAKVDILDEVFRRAQQKLRELPDNEYRAWMAKLMLEAVETGDEQVLAAKDDARIDERLVDEVNGKLRADGKGKLTLSPDQHNLEGGFILARGRIRTNVSLGMLLDQARKDLEIELARTLFPNDAHVDRAK